jgi:bifunctional DNA-binding transcriptional regulator/antitoxin component of YhaV-PrlF toxin-antitoxin module
MDVKLKVKLQRKITRKSGKKVYYHYYITLPSKVVEVLGLDKYVDKEIEVVLILR